MSIRGTLLGIWVILWLAALACWLRARGDGRVSREGVLFLLLGIPFLVAGWFFTSSSYPLEVRAPTPAPLAVIATTPAPAPPPVALPVAKTYTQAVNAAQHAAVARYPDLGRAGTVFNTRFIAAYRQLRDEDPRFFTDPNWPLRLADEIARSPAEPP